MAGILAGALMAAGTVWAPAAGAHEPVCDQIPRATDRWGNSHGFCEEPDQWAFAMSEPVSLVVCAAIPDMTDDSGTRRDFCDDPNAWIVAALQTTCRTGACLLATVTPTQPTTKGAN